MRIQVFLQVFVAQLEMSVDQRQQGQGHAENTDDHELAERRVRAQTEFNRLSTVLILHGLPGIEWVEPLKVNLPLFDDFVSLARHGRILKNDNRCPVSGPDTYFGRRLRAAPLRFVRPEGRSHRRY